MRINSINNPYNSVNHSIKNQNNAESKNISFNGGVQDGLKKVYKKFADAEPVQNTIKKISKYDTFTHILVVESTILSGFYMLSTLFNKNIDEKQKPQMIINDGLTLGLSTASAYFAEGKITKAVNRKAEDYFERNKEFYREKGKESVEKGENPLDKLLNIVEETVGKKGEDLKNGISNTTKKLDENLKGIVGRKDADGKLKTFQVTEDKIDEVKEKVGKLIEEAKDGREAKEKVKQTVSSLYEDAAARAQAEKTLSGIGKLKVLVIFGLIYRFAGPVLITPIANKLSSKFFPSAKN